jgi:hypothetical protein
MQIFDILYYKRDARSSRAYPKDAIQISGEEMEEEEERIDEELDDVEEVYSSNATDLHDSIEIVLKGCACPNPHTGLKQHIIL